jgi:hypothetical protein
MHADSPGSTVVRADARRFARMRGGSRRCTPIRTDARWFAPMHANRTDTRRFARNHTDPTDPRGEQYVRQRKFSRHHFYHKPGAGVNAELERINENVGDAVVAALLPISGFRNNLKLSKTP